MREIAGVAGTNVKLKLQFSTSSDFSKNINDVTELASCTDDSLWCYAEGGGEDNEVIKQALLPGANECTDKGGDGCGTHNESGQSVSNFKHKKNRTVEYEFVIVARAVLSETVYFFRAYDVKRKKPVLGVSGYSLPNVTLGAGSLTFTISGLGAKVKTEGVITDIGTTPTQISFGVLPLEKEVTAAQRLTVTNTGGRGYRIFVFERQPLQGPAEIFPFFLELIKPLCRGFSPLKRNPLLVITLATTL